MPSFRASKWYLDCVSDSGDVSILYTGRAKWGAFELCYSSILEEEGGRTASRVSFAPEPEPVVSGETASWRSARLAVEGTWRADAEEVRCVLYCCEAGSVEWRCLMPRATARIGTCSGLGYVEHLALSVAPWKLPIQTLRWGRFLSSSEWIVWIEWKGEVSRTVVYRSGRLERTLAIEDAAIQFADGSRLNMDQTLTIREGPLGSTALAALPGVRHSVPGQILRTLEHKWRSRARFTGRDGKQAEGWAIHERVEWRD